METLLNYILESSIALGVLILVYRSLLKNLNNLLLNRIYIVTAMVFASVVPFLRLQVTITNTTTLLPGVTTIQPQSNLLEAITIYADETNNALIDWLKGLSWMHYLYITGLVLLLIRIIWGLFKLHLFKRQASIEKLHGYILVDTHSDLEPFSFFRLLFINRKRYNSEEYSAILHHEKAHIQLKHSLDNLLMELILIIQWFNPLAWLLRIDLKETHEFQADRYTIGAGVNPKFYKTLLLGNAMGTRISLGNNLNQLLIKKRLKMINNRINKSPGVLRLAAVLAAFTLLLLVFACEQDDQKVYQEVDIMPEYPGSFDAVRAEIQENLNYPEAAIKSSTEGRVFIQFVVNKKGKVTDATVTRSVSPELDAEALRVVNLLGSFTPGIKNGEKVNVQFTIPIIFELPIDEVFSVVEDMPQFEGGIPGVQDYIRKNILYPEAAKENGITGKAYVSFVVGKSGMVKDVKIERSTGNTDLDNEAKRVVKSLPNWEPGRQSNQPVAVSYTIPIEFLLTDKGGAMVINKTSLNREKMRTNIKYEVIDGKIYAKGIISDINNAPLSGTSVIIKGTGTGTTTNEKGEFSIMLSEKNQELVISHVGKETINWSN